MYFGPLVGLFRALPLNRDSHRYRSRYINKWGKEGGAGQGSIMPMDTI